VNAQGANYTVKTFITRPAETLAAGSAQYRRASVVVSWPVYGQLRVRRATSDFTDTRRGLPLPRFSFGTPVTIETNVGAFLAIPASLTNVGAPDAFKPEHLRTTRRQRGLELVPRPRAQLRAFDRPVTLGGSDPSDTLLLNSDTDAAALPDTT
jgi:hypothetical protein